MNFRNLNSDINLDLVLLFDNQQQPTPTARNWCFGAETGEERQQWMQALESVINKRSSIPNDAIKESTRSDLRDSYIKRSKLAIFSIFCFHILLFER